MLIVTRASTLDGETKYIVGVDMLDSKNAAFKLGLRPEPVYSDVWLVTIRNKNVLTDAPVAVDALLWSDLSRKRADDLLRAV